MDTSIEATRDLREPKNILFNLPGHGLLDLSAYDYDYPEEAVEAARKNLPKI